MSNWQDILKSLRQMKGPAVLVSVGTVKGSTPRETGATMLVTEDAPIGTIGGGRLEYLAIEKAREILLASSSETDLILQLPLGPELAQCCGGYADILMSRLPESIIKELNRLNLNNEQFVLLTHWSNTGCQRQILSKTETPTYLEPGLQSAISRRLAKAGSEIVPGKTAIEFTMVQSLHSAEFHVTIFGAGHVGRAVVRALSPLPCSILWIDERADQFPEGVAPNVDKIVSAHPTSEIPALPADSFHLVMTHSHQLDLEICEAILRRGDEAYLGLIGSETKNAKFQKRLAVHGLQKSDLNRMICPIGLPSLSGKRPEEIALGVAADILMRHQQRNSKMTPLKSEGAYGS